MRRRLDSLSRTTASLAKDVCQHLLFSERCSKRIGLILGVQRSGTGMLVQAFANDWSCKSFGEDGGLAVGPTAGHTMRWRWKPYGEVADILRRQRAPLVIAKPLVESQNADAINAALPEARFIWAYRNYRDVVKSGQEHFGSEAIKYNVQSIILRRSHWYSENVDDVTRDLVVRFLRKERSILDLRALGWCIRNSIVFRHSHLPIAFSSYEDLVSSPSQKMRELYEFLGRPYPGDHIVRHIHGHSVKRGRDLQISSDVRVLCESVMDRLIGLSRNTERSHSVAFRTECSSSQPARSVGCATHSWR